MLYTQVESILSQLPAHTPKNDGRRQGLSAHDITESEILRQEVLTLQEVVESLKLHRDSSNQVQRQLRARCEQREHEIRRLSSLLAASELAKDALLLDQCSISSLTTERTETADRYLERAHSIAFADSQRDAARRNLQAAAAEIQAHRTRVMALEQKLSEARDETRMARDHIVVMEKQGRRLPVTMICAGLQLCLYDYTWL